MDTGGRGEGAGVSWQRALAYVSQRASGPPVDPGLAVTVHFHPDRLVGGVPLLRHLVNDGVYRSQFETRTGNGGLTAHPGGDRWRWEHRMFGGAYDDAPPAERPKYGSLNHHRRPSGGSVRFGSAYLCLARDVLRRTTFCYPDSVTEPSDFGTADHLGLIAVAEADARGGEVDVLDDHIEAHVHGPLRLDRDVDALVLDPAYRGTEVEAAALALPFPMRWHHGFRLHVDVLAAHAAYRGAEIVRVAREIAEGGLLDARVIGDAVRAGRHDPQDLKRVWHCTARFGHTWPRR
ncbi:hypothetical protein CFN78_15500 [Amycolatopsis antarctica]|uniref:DUF3626 domain-containing protein n=1 Tax=Amycolatopsis antarctica TaxID=1854586 RepID=A0A263D2F7_9PSEU|nr:DUF3626 domain-containing protein [Amycolatopsis antarctica]OZM72389.1 hypothetical protein CFN78_15500 [Amycolatopsis antarctica]